ncbi:MAG TPA: TonB family protein [Terriglobia bacterium]|nr:TonB family protein [Terriglobia bacterium]
MSYQPLWLRDLVAYSIQAAALVGVGAILASLLRLRVPRVRLAYWQALLAVCVFLPLLQPWRPEVLETSGSVLGNVTFTTSATVAPSGPSLEEIVLWLISAGIVLRAAWMALGLGRLWLYRRHAQRIEQVPQSVEEAQRLAPVSPAFFISPQLPTPATFGFFRPTVLFPARFLEMEPAMQKAIVLHELLHVERRDWLWNLFEELVLTLLWFHLPLWWVVRSARLSREQVVDAEAVCRSKARRPYLKALLEMAGQKRLAESLPAPLFLRESQLAERVALMMKEVHMSRTRLTVSMLTAAATLLIVGASVVWAFPLKTSARQAESPQVSSAAAEAESGQKSAKALKGGSKVKAAEPIYKEQPKYPQQAKAKHLSGKVILSCVIDAEGNVTEVTEVSKPLGGGLDESAMDAVRNWKYKPATLDGVPVKVKTDVTINFTLLDKPGKDSHKSSSAIDPPAQGNQNISANTNQDHNTNFNQQEIQHQVEQALKQAKISQQAIPKIDQAKIQEQVDQAMKQLKMAKMAAPQIDQAKINLQIEEQMKQLQKLSTPEMRERMRKQMEQLAKLNTPEMRQRMQEQMKQLQKLSTPEMRERMQKQMEQLQKMNTPEMRRKIEAAMKQAQIAEAQKLNSAEVRQQLKQTQDELQAARKQLEQTREQLKTERLELRKNREAAKPLPPGPPKPASPSAKPVPPPPPASPPPPPVKTPQANGVVGGVTGGVPSAPKPPAPSTQEAVPPAPPVN